MNTKPLEKFAQTARRQLQEQVSAKLSRVLRTDSAALRAQAEAIAELKQEIEQSSREAVVERVAYTWFNRFCALRFMDVNHYTSMGVVSPATAPAGEAYTQPEILQEAKQGYIDPDLPVDREAVFGLLAGRLPSSDPQQEAYRLLLVGVCNHYHRVMPFMFERIEDYTELLMPDDLLSSGSILQATREALTPEACQDVEVIGWLYQFYISEKKDAVFASKKKIAPEDIPAVTQLFTPHWIVRYLVENSLGRLWLLNRPHSRLVEQMPYYIKPEQEESDYLRVGSPEELRVCDPAVGSGHMLTYAFDLLYAIYEEEGYNAPDIPRLILEKNLVGIEIDERAGALAAFALTMKAREKDRRFFRRDVRPRITVLQPVRVSEEELIGAPWLKQLGTNLLDLPLRDALRDDLQQFEQVDNIGSLLRPHLTLAQITELSQHIQASSDLFSADLNQRVQQVLTQLTILARKYHVVVANPPYMGSGKFNPRLKNLLSKDYKVTRSDLYAIFIERSFDLLKVNGYLAMITMQSWMFTRSYEELRDTILNKCQINTLAQLGTKAFDAISGEIVQTCVFVLQLDDHRQGKTTFVRLVDGDSSHKEETLRRGDCRFVFDQSNFAKIPGKVMVYWTGDFIIDIFENFPSASEFGEFREGIHTGDNNSYLRYWWEIDGSKLSLSEISYESIDSNRIKWIPYNKGGAPVRWYGGNEWVIAFDRQSRNAMKELSGHVRPSQKFYFREGATWPDVSSGKFGVRYYPGGYLFDAKGPVFVGNYLLRMTAVLNSRVFTYLAGLLMPTLAFKCGTVRNIPVPDLTRLSILDDIASELIMISRNRWDSYEMSWDFSENKLVKSRGNQNRVDAIFRIYTENTSRHFERYKALELENWTFDNLSATSRVRH